VNRLFRRWDEIVTRPIVFFHDDDAKEDRGASPNRDAGDEVRRRYILARFPGVLHSLADLGRIAHVIKSARIYLEDGNVRRAEELLDLARCLHPETEALWLARLELAMRVGDADGYRFVALAYREQHPDSLLWAEVAAFGRSLCLADEAFLTDEEPSMLKRDWLQTRWEPSPDVTCADLRRLLNATQESAAA
jgi:hypothetical protein